MKKEVIICIIVILLVVVGNVITQNYTKQSVEILTQELSQLTEKINLKEKNDISEQELKRKSRDIKDKWDDMQEILSFYIEHDELEKVETQLFLLEGEIQTRLYDDAIPEIEKCKFILEHIEDKTALNVKNIF